MKPHHVLARLAKRAERCAPSCPGWRVADMSDGKRAKVVACAECNALARIGLRVTDADLRQLAVAKHDAVARERVLARDLAARATTTHIRVDPATTAVLCRREVGRTAGGKRKHGWTYAVAQASCGECLRLSALTPAQRRAEDEARTDRLRSVFGRARAEAVAERERIRSARAMSIHDARPDAMVALDAWEQADGWPVDQDQYALVENALKKAVEAHRHFNPKSRGDRLWVMRDTRGRVGNKCCRFCGVCLEEGMTLGVDRTFGGQGLTRDHTVPCALKYLAGDLAPKEGSTP